MYPASFVFQVPSTAYIALICVNVFVGVIGTISTFILEWFQDDAVSRNDISNYLVLAYPERVTIFFSDLVCLSEKPIETKDCLV